MITQKTISFVRNSKIFLTLSKFLLGMQKINLIRMTLKIHSFQVSLGQTAAFDDVLESIFQIRVYSLIEEKNKSLKIEEEYTFFAVYAARTH